jgi:hypothetical protein
MTALNRIPADNVLWKKESLLDFWMSHKKVDRICEGGENPRRYSQKLAWPGA